MAKDVFMPALGMAQETGTLLQWLKTEGDEVTKGEPLMEIETDKATVEVEAPASGILTNITAQPGDEIPVGQVIAVIQAPGEETPRSLTVDETGPSTPTSTLPQAPAQSLDGQLPPTTPLAARMAAEHNVDLRQIPFKGSRIQKEDMLAHLGVPPIPQPAAPKRVLASPKARRLADEHKLELTAISGSGPEGAVLAADVLAAEAAAAATPAPIPRPTPTQATGLQTLPVSRVWQVMAARLSQSWTTVPHFYLTTEVKADQLISWRKNALERAKEKITFTDLFVKLVAITLRQHPRVNAMWQNESIMLNDEVNVGLAVAVDEGLLVPVVHQADHLGLNEIAARRNDLISRAQSGKLTLDDMSHGTFTISNLGMYGIDAFNAIVNPPQAAILAVGRIAERVVPVDGQPAVQPMMTLTLSCDHRIVDGSRAAQFLQTLGRLIENPLAALD